MEKIRETCLKLINIKLSDQLDSTLIKRKGEKIDKIVDKYNNKKEENKKAIRLAVGYLLSGDEPSITITEALELGMAYERIKVIMEREKKGEPSIAPTPGPAPTQRAGIIEKINSHYWVSGQQLRFKCEWAGKGELTEKLDVVLQHKEALKGYVNGGSLSKRALTTLRDRVPEIHNLVAAPEENEDPWENMVVNREWEEAEMEEW